MAENDVSWSFGGYDPGRLRVCQRRRKRSACSASLSIVVLWAFEAFRRPSEQRNVIFCHFAEASLPGRQRHAPASAPDRARAGQPLARCLPAPARPSQKKGLPANSGLAEEQGPCRHAVASGASRPKADGPLAPKRGPRWHVCRLRAHRASPCRRMMFDKCSELGRQAASLLWEGAWRGAGPVGRIWRSKNRRKAA